MSAGAEPSACNCAPSYYGVVWDRTARKARKTRRFKRVMEARNARKDLADALLQGTELAVAGPRLDDARKDFIAAARDGVALNKWGRHYRRRAWEDLESSLRRLPDALTRRRLGDITRGDVQAFIDDMTRAGASGSRVRSVVNAVRSLYRWAQDRDLVGHDPAANVRLPAMEATPRDRVAAPAEFAQLLAALELTTRCLGRSPATGPRASRKSASWTGAMSTGSSAPSSWPPTRRAESRAGPGASSRW